MAVSYVTQANANSASTTVTSKTITIPSVAAGDVLLLVANCYSGASGSSTINISSTGTAWTRQGSSTYVAGTSAQNNGSLFYLTAGASETGKVVTISTSVSLYYNITMVVYRGASLPFDGVQIASSTTLTTSCTCPTITTTNAGTWLATLGSLCNGSAGFSSCSGPSLASTAREANFGSASGIAVATDSNGAVSAGSQVPGHFTPSTTADYITWSVGIAPVPVGPTAGLAVGSGTVQAPAAVPAVNPTAGLAAGADAALAAAPAIGVAAGLATGMDAAQAPAALPAVNPAAGLATGTGTALTVPLANAAAGLATATAGTAKAPTAAVAVNPSAGLATGSDAAHNASTAGSTNVSGGLAYGTGTAQNPAGIGVVFTAQTVQFPTAFAQDATVAANVPVTAGLATATGTAQAAAPAAAVTAGLATATGTALAAAPAAGVTAGLAAGTGTARSTAVVLAAAAGTGTAQPPAGTAIVFTAGLAAGTGTAQTVRPSTISPVLEGYGFGTFPQVPFDSVILSVVADIVWYGSDASILQPSYELWDGTSARIGSPQQGVASDTPGNRDSVVFTGVTYAQLATLRLRMTAGTAAGNSGATVSVDAMSLAVTWAPGQTATIAPAVLAIVPAFPAPVVSGVVNASVTPDPMAVVPQFPAPAAGFEQAQVFPAVLAAAIVIPAAAAAAGTTVTPGVLALAPAFPAITDITAPGWASADDIPVSGTGTWVNPGNIIGPPDGSNAVWTVP